MDEKRKRVTAPRIAAALSVLLAGAALYTVSGSERQGIQVKEYAEAAEAADSTIMVYMNGSDLEGDYGAATADLWEMMDAFKVMEQEGKSPSLHVVVEAGGSTGGSWMKWMVYLCQIFPDRGWNIIMESMEIRNMGDADTLTDFINYGVRSYPANHYGLILWNHGGGPVGGYGSDSHFDGDGLSLEEIRELWAIQLWQTVPLTLWRLTPVLWEVWRLPAVWMDMPIMSLHLRSWNLSMDMITDGWRLWETACRLIWNGERRWAGPWWRHMVPAMPRALRLLQ